jgi:hypothetical protein
LITWLDKSIDAWHRFLNDRSRRQGGNWPSSNLSSTFLFPHPLGRGWSRVCISELGSILW